MTVYQRTQSGVLERRDMHLVDGEVYLDRITCPERLEFIGTETLMGWGRNDGRADVYRREGGQELLVPERFADRVRVVVKGGAE